MTTSEKMNYARPPITEAVIELRFASHISDRKLDGWVKKLKARYPSIKKTIPISIQVPTAPTTDMIPVKQDEHGFRLSTDDQACIVILNRYSVAIARLAPYYGWDDFFSHAKAVFKLTEKSGQIAGVTRIGVRYINRIDIPCDEGPTTDVGRYMKLNAGAPEGVFSQSNQSVVQINGDLQNKPWMAQLTSARVDSPLMNHISLLLDIDVYRDSQIATSATNIYNLIEEARGLKNMLFKACITPDTEALFGDA